MQLTLFLTTVELHATESGQKFQQFLIQAVHPTYISVSDSQSLMKGAGFFTNASNEWEPITCRTTNVSQHCKLHACAQNSKRLACSLQACQTWQTTVVTANHIAAFSWLIALQSRKNQGNFSHDLLLTDNNGTVTLFIMMRCANLNCPVKSIQDSAVSTSSILKERVYLTWETPSSHILTKFW